MKPVTAGTVAVEQPLEIPTLTIEPTSGWLSLGLGEIREYRELLYFLVWRDVKVRYKQTVLGAAWALIQPLATMAVFSLFLGRAGGLPSGDIPYPLFVLSGLLPWFLFAGAVTSCSQ